MERTESPFLTKGIIYEWRKVYWRKSKIKKKKWNKTQSKAKRHRDEKNKFPYRYINIFFLPSSVSVCCHCTEFRILFRSNIQCNWRQYQFIHSYNSKRGQWKRQQERYARTEYSRKKAEYNKQRKREKDRRKEHHTVISSTWAIHGINLAIYYVVTMLCYFFSSPFFIFFHLILLYSSFIFVISFIFFFSLHLQPLLLLIFVHSLLHELCIVYRVYRCTQVNLFDEQFFLFFFASFFWMCVWYVLLYVYVILYFGYVCDCAQ